MTWTGVSAATLRPIEGLDHIVQSIRDILATPLGSRIMRPEYGSRLPRLVDAPINPATLVDLYAATAESVARWEPRVKLTRVRAVEAGQGRVTLALDLTVPLGRSARSTQIEVTL
jgi:phage baseplate assembly protein W